MSNDVDRWIHDDGPEPEDLRSFLDALRNPPPAVPEATESRDRRLSERLDAAVALLATEEGPGRESGRGAHEGEHGPVEAAGAPVMRRLAAGGATLRCAVDELVAMVPPAAPDPAPPSLAPPSQIPPFPPSLPPVVRPPAGLVETARSMDWTASRRERGLRSPGGAAVVPFPFPPMTVVQYASLRAELAMWPGWARAILGKYQVTNEAALEEHWQARWRGRPDERAAFEQAFVEYTAWLQAYAASGGQGR